MTFEWHDHHFITHVACLDLANTIVWRSDPLKREDRLRDARDLAAWIQAFGRFTGQDLTGESPATLDPIIGIRHIVDDYFRKKSGWTALVQLYGKALGGIGHGLERVLLHSAMELAFSDQLQRVKVCGNCGWLFIDRTRNQNKRWCIPELCGNRTKARRHYALKKLQHSV